MKKILAVLLMIAFTLAIPPALRADSMSGDYLCELGINYYEDGDYANALHEFNKALMVDPYNATAKEYIALIHQETTGYYSDAPAARSRYASESAPYRTYPQQPPYSEEDLKITSRETQVTAQRTDDTSCCVKAVSPAPARPAAVKPARKRIVHTSEEGPDVQPQTRQPVYDGQRKIKAVVEEEDAGLLDSTPHFVLSGQVQASIGIDSSDGFIWKRANFDMNEKNWRMLSYDNWNKMENTHDYRIFDRLRLNLDTDNKTGFGFHTTIIVDPWSFTGSTDEVTIGGAGGDYARVKLKYSANSDYTLNESGYTRLNGDSYSLPEIEVKNGKTVPTTIRTAFGNTITIPAMEIHKEFQPLRELWAEYKEENAFFRIFPFGYENQALTFDDPLRLSNNKTWWENSPWTNSWKPGIYNSGSTPVDFTKGYWDNGNSFSVKDSEGSRLTQLRGATLKIGKAGETQLSSTIAAARDWWQEYEDIDNAISATRFTSRIGDSLKVGASYGLRMGFVNTELYDDDEEGQTDARNMVGGIDAQWELTQGILASAETAVSHSDYDMTSVYRTTKRGNAFFGSLMGRNDAQVMILDEKYGFDGIAPQKGESFFTKWRLMGAHMDEGFDTSLSNYKETRDDEFWSRHIHFRKPFKLYSLGFYEEPMTFDSINTYAIGNGIDVGRDVVGLRVESALLDQKINNLIDVRNVHATNGKYIETVARDELTFALTDKLTFKGLGLYNDLPKTHAGTDPFIFNPITGRYYDNNQIIDGADPSVKTWGSGLEYEFTDWFSINGTWEHTNDYYLGYDGFPRGILNDGNMSVITTEYNKRYRELRNWLYNQQYFPNAPYPTYDIFKAGLRFLPIEKIEIYLDYTRNEYGKAGQVDNNMNHIGIEINYLPVEKLRLSLHYQYSRWQDLDVITEGNTKMYGHHNVFAEIMYCMSKNEDFVLQFGEAGRMPMYGEIITITWDPYPGSLWRSIDTQHLVRMFYRKRF